MKASIKCKRITGKYHLQTHYKKYRMVSSALCQLCECVDEDLLHFVTSCKILEEVRVKNVAFLADIVSSQDVTLWEDTIIDNHKLLQMWLDCTHPILDFNLTFQAITKIEEVSRNYLFAIHKQCPVLVAALPRGSRPGRQPTTECNCTYMAFPPSDSILRRVRLQIRMKCISWYGTCYSQ